MVEDDPVDVLAVGIAVLPQNTSQISCVACAAQKRLISGIGTVMHVNTQCHGHRASERCRCCQAAQPGSPVVCRQSEY
jgi:hypothetical protein